jgi:hypothetical protein
MITSVRHIAPLLKPDVVVYGVSMVLLKCAQSWGTRPMMELTATQEKVQSIG